MNYVYSILLLVLANAKIITITNLDKWVSKNNLTLVLFTTPLCPRCSELVPELTAASEMISVGSPGSFGVPVAQINDYPLDAYPIMRFYVNGVYTEVQSKWTKAALEQWMDKRVLSYISDTDNEPSIRWIHESYNISVVAFDEILKEELTWFKYLKNDIHFTYSTHEKARELLGVGSETTLVMYTEKGLNKYEYDGEFNFEKVFKFISSHERKFYQDFDEEAIQQIFYQRQKNILFIFDNKDYRDLAKTYQKNFETVVVRNESERLTNFLGIKGILHPLAVIYDGRKYRLQYQNMAELKQFVQNYQANKLKPYFKSQSPYKNQEWEKQILNIVGEDFPKHEDIFILFFQPWCRHSQELMPIFEQLARKYQGTRAFGTFNAQDNEVDDTSIKETPLFRWYNNKDKKVVTYDGPMTVEGMSEFVEKQTTGRVVSDEL